MSGLDELNDIVVWVEKGQVPGDWEGWKELRGPPRPNAIVASSNGFH